MLDFWRLVMLLFLRMFVMLLRILLSLFKKSWAKANWLCRAWPGWFTSMVHPRPSIASAMVENAPALMSFARTAVCSSRDSTSFLGKSKWGPTQWCLGKQNKKNKSAMKAVLRARTWTKSKRLSGLNFRGKLVGLAHFSCRGEFYKSRSPNMSKKSKE